tara:strand:- start:12 stop:248 length:237 start_codon:yes stop_codon:yes gene_type:complete
MSYSIVHTIKDTPEIKIYGSTKYKKDSDGKDTDIIESQRSCLGTDKKFQQWLRENKDNLPADIQAEIDSGNLIIEESD